MNRLHRRNRRRKILAIIFTVGVILFFLFQMIMAPIKIANLKENKIVTTGLITGVTMNEGLNGGGFKYVFYIGDKQYTGSTAYANLSPRFCETLLGQNFPVIYSANQIKNNEILLTEEMFRTYGMEQPDSLKWIERYVER